MSNTTTDKELLELAAKAGCLEITFENGCPQRIEMFRDHLTNYEYWNPLTDDGDALRLAVKLDMTIASCARLNKVMCYMLSTSGL